MVAHKHAELIKQWADGAEIQELNPSDNEWYDTYPSWNEDTQYRIKPEELKWYNNIPNQGKLCWTWIDYAKLDKRIELIFGYFSDTNLFYGSANTFEYAVPLTKEEIQEYFIGE